MSFALAAANCGPRWQSVREYLVHHANEEMLHYQWILDDLASIGYRGPDPRELVPSVDTSAYIAFNHYNAHVLPPSRLASSTVLEGLASQLQPDDYRKVFTQPGLSQSSFSFFLRHVDTDREHIKELWAIIEDLELTDREWRWMKHAARVPSALAPAGSGQLHRVWV